MSRYQYRLPSSVEMWDGIRKWTPALIIALFAFRLLYGLSSEFFFEDETQIFLMGFRYYATGQWPYFGPDVVWTKSEIPGALQPWLVGAPLNLVPVPESPFVLLNLLSTASLRALAFLAGALGPAIFLIPTWLHYGLNAGSGGLGRNIHVHWVNPLMAVTTLARFLSFASLEINRFIATDGAKRIEFFQRHLWLLPLAAIVWAAGIVQPIWMVIEWLRRRGAPT